MVARFFAVVCISQFCELMKIQWHCFTTTLTYFPCRDTIIFINDARIYNILRRGFIKIFLK